MSKEKPKSGNFIRDFLESHEFEVGDVITHTAQNKNYLVLKIVDKFLCVECLESGLYYSIPKTCAVFNWDATQNMRYLEEAIKDAEKEQCGKIE